MGSQRDGRQQLLQQSLCNDAHSGDAQSQSTVAMPAYRPIPYVYRLRTAARDDASSKQPEMLRRLPFRYIGWHEK